MIGHHTRRMNEHACLLGGPSEAVEDDLVGFLRRAKPEGALVATSRKHVRDERADASGGGHGRHELHPVCQRHCA